MVYYVKDLGLCILLIAFGRRLGFYLFIRECKAVACRKILYDPSLQQKKSKGATITVYILCALLYVIWVSPVYFWLMNTVEGE